MTKLTYSVLIALVGVSISMFVAPAQAFSPLEPQVAAFDTADYAELLAKYVSADGVRYEAWSTNAADLNKLNEFLSYAAQIDVATLSAQDQKAFYINLYNTGMLQAVLKRYPLKSAKNIGLIPFSIFKKDFIKQGDRELSLDDIEKGILLKDFADPRIHFVVNCASESCPPLRAEPYQGVTLDTQLDEQTRLFAQSDRAVWIDTKKKRVAYSELFKWYKGDFPGKHPAEYLNKYRSEKLPIDGKLNWIPYDWSLNITK